MLKQAVTTLTLETRGRGMLDVTSRVREWASHQRMRTGLLTLFLRHTSASLLIQENADPQVLADFERFFARLVPDGDPLFRHVEEGPDDMPAHIRTALTQTQLAVPLIDGALALGIWQGLYVCEHRLRGHHRELVLHLLGE